MKKILLTILCVLLISPYAFALEKNVNSQKWSIFCFDDTDNSAKTGDAAQITGSIWKDGVEDVIADGAPTETAHGQYFFDLDQAESNCEHCVMDAVSATGDIQCVGMPMALWTTPPDFSGITIANSAVDANITYVQEDAVTDNGDGLLDTNLKEINQTATQLEQFMDLTTGVASDGDLSGIIVDASALSHIMTPAASTITYKGSTDSLEAIKVFADTIKAETVLILADTDDIGVAGVGLTEAGGDGDQLTAINLPNQTMDIIGNITGDLSGTVGTVTTLTGQTPQSQDHTTNVNAIKLWIDRAPF